MTMAVCHLVILAAMVAAEDTSNLVDLTHYHVTTDVQSRLLKTTIDMTFRRRDDNTTTTNTTAQLCGPVIHTMTLQLPRLARVQSLEMDLSNDCTLDSQVQGLEQAKDTFENMASEGKSAAILTAWDMSNYKLQIVIPPPPANSTAMEQEPTKVKLTYTELLVQKNHQVSFQLPVNPGMAVSDSLEVDFTVQDENAGILELNLKDAAEDTGNFRRKLSNHQLAFDVTLANPKRAIAHFQESNLTEDSSLPRLVRGFFRPAPLPEAGVLTIPLLEEETKEEVCLTHVFNPSDFLATAGSLPKNMVFVIDISGSMSGDRLENAKVAFASMVSLLQDNTDAFAVQTFSSLGTETLWGPAVANPSTKQEATSFVQSLHTTGSTNLHDAYLDGIKHAKSMASDIDSSSAAVPILVVLSDGEASEGITNRAAIAKNVREANTEGQVKIFSLAFGSSADVDLLTGIALQNGGKVLQIFEGFDDTVQQMEDFYQQELEQIVLSDIGISFFLSEDDGSVGVASANAATADASSLLPLSMLDATTSRFPVLADGSELVIRGKVSRSDLPTDSSFLQASISALSAVGNQDWLHQYDLPLPDLDNGSSSAINANPPLIVNDCEQAFAHARIEELLDYRNAARALGDDLTTSTSSTSTFEEQARKMAIDAQLVWPGLTALVTVENPACQQLLPQAEQESEGNDSPVCYSGESGSGGYGGDFVDGFASGGPSSRGYSNYGDSSSLQMNLWWSMAGLLSVTFFVLLC
eukprot:CAMPEP_0113615804 /NCGR_PEP_ID=MMETSP0017_2-20120614/7900_1 /TAXON_ID=2856 /ORGANISM="Cylindrotheca closterium" /LENGTH=751 /DNA_ID=CAMNT_0000525073 /DNA_START=183 /DNA_END=2438 /DNA_ORIENTATION=- /assembly_acc=CAM_ASM_000147